MKKRILAALRRHEIYLVAAVIGIVFVAAMGIVAWLLRSSIVTPPYEELKAGDLKRVFATAYLRFREEDGTPYLKVEVHNGTLWWIKRLEFSFEGVPYTLRDSDAFRPLHFGALRCNLKKSPTAHGSAEYRSENSQSIGVQASTGAMERGHRDDCRWKPARTNQELKSPQT